MLGLPFEKEEDIFKSIGINKLCKTESQSIGNFYPYKGTPIRQMLIKEGLLNEEAEKEILTKYDFTSLTTNNKSAIKFLEMDTNIISKLAPLFGIYITWPVILWPLIDLVKNDEENGEFILLLWDKLKDVTYFKRYNEWPEKSVFFNATNELESKYDLNDKVANEFVKLLISSWGENFKEEINEKLLLIKEGSLKPNFPIPENDDELKSFVGVNKITDDEHRVMRKRLRNIAETSSALYKS